MKMIRVLVFFVFAAAMYAELSSSSVSEAVEQLVGQRAHMTNEIHLLAGSSFTGPAVTMHLVRDEKASIGSWLCRNQAAGGIARGLRGRCGAGR